MTRKLHFEKSTAASLGDHKIESNVLCVFSTYRPDDRASLSFWESRAHGCPDTHLVIEEETDEAVLVRRGGDPAFWLDLRDKQRVGSFLRAPHVLLDLSGMGNHVWAALLRGALETCGIVQAAYTEPGYYRFHSTPSSLFSFDLSDRFRGLSPLPGFANLRGPSDESRTVFVPLLGFEGCRPRQVIVQIDPAPPVIVPIVGVPGFQLEYPTYTIACNQEFLEEQRAYKDVRLAMADDPFEALKVLEEIKRDYADYHFYVAPLGTKPHALAAVLFAIRNFEAVEILYDHPVKRQGGRAGCGRTHLYLIKDR